MQDLPIQYKSLKSERVLDAIAYVANTSNLSADGKLEKSTNEEGEPVAINKKGFVAIPDLILKGLGFTSKSNENEQEYNLNLEQTQNLPRNDSLQIIHGQGEVISPKSYHSINTGTKKSSPYLPNSLTLMHRQGQKFTQSIEKNSEKDKNNVAQEELLTDNDGIQAIDESTIEDTDITGLISSHKATYTKEDETLGLNDDVTQKINIISASRKEVNSDASLPNAAAVLEQLNNIEETLQSIPNSQGKQMVTQLLPALKVMVNGQEEFDSKKFNTILKGIEVQGLRTFNTQNLRAVLDNPNAKPSQKAEETIQEEIRDDNFLTMSNVKSFDFLEKLATGIEQSLKPIEQYIEDKGTDISKYSDNELLDLSHKLLHKDFVQFQGRNISLVDLMLIPRKTMKFLVNPENSVSNDNKSKLVAQFELAEKLQTVNKLISEISSSFSRGFQTRYTSQKPFVGDDGEEGFRQLINNFEKLSNLNHGTSRDYSTSSNLGVIKAFKVAYEAAQNNQSNNFQGNDLIVDTMRENNYIPQEVKHVLDLFSIRSAQQINKVYDSAFNSKIKGQHYINSESSRSFGLYPTERFIRSLYLLTNNNELEKESHQYWKSKTYIVETLPKAILGAKNVRAIVDYNANLAPRERLTRNKSTPITKIQVSALEKLTEDDIYELETNYGAVNLKDSLIEFQEFVNPYLKQPLEFPKLQVNSDPS